MVTIRDVFNDSVDYLYYPHSEQTSIYTVIKTKVNYVIK